MQLFIRYVLAPLVRLVWRPRVRGADRIPATGPVILAANHRAAVDTAFIPLVAPRKVAFLGKAEYFTGRGLRGRLMAAFLGALGYIPVDRSNARAGLAARRSNRGAGTPAHVSVRDRACLRVRAGAQCTFV